MCRWTTARAPPLPGQREETLRADEYATAPQPPQLFYEIRVVCYEALEYLDFPFSRQMFQIRLGLKVPRKFQILRPYNEVLPNWEVASDEEGVRIKATRLRTNLFKHTTTFIGCWRMVSHSIDIVPEKLTPRMPSGQKYPIVTIALYMEQAPDYFVCT